MDAILQGIISDHLLQSFGHFGDPAKGTLRSYSAPVGIGVEVGCPSIHNQIYCDVGYKHRPYIDATNKSAEIEH